MATLKIYNREGDEVGDYTLDPTIIAPRINKQLLHDAVVMYQSNLRQGSHKTKSRSEVRGATTKMYRQKGTGRARAGSRKTNIRRGGGMAFPKRPRDYSYRMPRKALRTATRMAIASKVLDEQVVVINELEFAEPGTREMALVLSALGLKGVRTLVATETSDVNVYKSARNIQKVTVSPVSDLNALSVLTPHRLLVTKAAMDAIVARAKGVQPDSSPQSAESPEGRRGDEGDDSSKDGVS